MAKKKKSDEPEEELTEEEAEEQAALAKKKKKKKIVLLLILFALVYQFKLKGSPPPEDEVEAEVIIEEGEIAPVGELVVNLADVDTVHYLRLGVAAVLNAEFTMEEIQPQLPKVSDVVIDVVQRKTFEDLRKPGATKDLKDEISEALQEVFEEGEVVRVIFTTFVMQ